MRKEPAPQPESKRPRSAASGVAGAAAARRDVNGAPAATGPPVGLAGGGGLPGSGAPSGGGTGSGGGRGAGSGSGDGADLRVACLDCPSPRYPRRAAARGVEGTVDVGFALAGDGTVREVTLRRSSGSRDLDEAAMQVARRSRFKLGGAAGPAVPRGYIAYRFELADRGR